MPLSAHPSIQPPSGFFTQWLILGCALLILGGATGLNLYLERGRTESREQERLMTQARVVQENTALNLLAINKVLTSLSPPGIPERHHLPSDISLATLVDGMPGVRTLLITDAEGTIRAINHRDLLGKSVSDRAYFQEIKQHPDADTLYISRPFRTVLGIYTVNAVRILTGPHGEFTGVVAAGLDPTYFAPLLESVRYAPDMWSAMAHDEGDIFLIQPEKEGIIGKNVAKPGTFFSKHKASGQIATVHAGYAYITGEDRLLVWRTVRIPQLKMDHPLAVTVSRDLETVFVAWNKDLLIQGGLFGLIALSSTFGLFLYQRRQREFEHQASAAAEALRQTAERLHLATEAAGVGVWDYNPVTNQLTWDQSMYAIYGISLPAAPITYADWIDTVQGEDLPAIEAAMHTAIEQRQTFKSRFQIRRGDGTIRVIKAMAQIHYDADNRPIRMVGTNEDVTERQQLEDARKESEQRFRTTFNAAAIGMALIDPAGSFLRCNQALCQILGYTNEELRHKTIQQITHPDDQESTQHHLRGLIAGKYESYQLEKRYFHKEGHLIWVRLNSSAVRDPAGKPLYFITQIQDITEDRKNQQAVIDSERFMRKLTDIIPGMVGYWDAQLRCGFANAAYLEWFGKSPEQMHGIHITELMGETLFKKNEPYIRAALRGTSQHFERTLTKVDGSTGYTWAHYIPDLDGNRVRGFFVLVADITELKRTQLQLEQRTAEAEAASHSKSQFLANMSHEIRTPMNAILGLLHLLQRTELTPRQYDYAHKVEAAAQSLLSILNDILDFSKVEAGKLELENIPFTLDEVLQNLAVILSASVPDGQLEVIFDIDPAIPATLIGDAMRLQQVLLNLAGNAIKFTPHGDVIVSAQARQITPGQVDIDFSVRDSGIGIEPSKLASLFEGFTQAEASTSRRFGGSGLGLAISQRLTHLMGGELTASSQPGQGSEFNLRLSFARPLPTVPASTEASQVQAPLRLLIIDDNAASRAALNRMATGLGWQVHSAASGSEGLSAIEAAAKQQTPYDVLLIDWQMPGMDGWETDQHLRQLPAAGNLPILFMVTAAGREQLAQRQQQNSLPHIAGHLSKPVTPAKLLAAVAAASAGTAPPAIPKVTPRPRRLAGLRILVVEDHPINQQIARELLALEGAEVDIASGGQEGIDKLTEHPEHFDAVLMDIQMPGMDGYTATRHIRQQAGLTQLPIIAMTANALPQDRADCLAAGMNDHLGKPIDLNLLVDTLLLHCRHQSSPVSNTSPTAITDRIATQEVLTRLGHNYPLFARMARAFTSQHSNAVSRLQHLLQQGDRSGAVRELHALKGVAATLGARALARLAADAEEQLKVNDDPQATALLLERLHALIETSCNQLQQLVEQLLPEPQPLSNATIEKVASLDVAALTTRLDRLETLLATANLKALDEFTQLKEEFGPALGHHLAALDESMVHLDLPAALEKSRNLRTVIAHG